MEIGFFGLTVATFIACNGATRPVVSLVFSAAGAVIMTLSILQDSYDMAFRDELTGIPARRALNETLNGVGKSYVVAMADVDHFKKFNDTYGHDVGDQVLKLVAKRLAGVGGGGKAFRYGGEEFTILFHGLKAQDALPYLEEVRQEIADYPMAIRGDSRPSGKREGKRQRRGTAQSGHASVTVSIGVAESREGVSHEEVIKAADKALYKAKHAGRNQVAL
jgi:PleD family two-component response regulator